MTSRLHHQELLTRHEIVAPPAIAEERSCTDQNFGLPVAIYLAMFGFFAAAIAVLALAFGTNMIVTYAIIFALLIAFFGVPTLMVRTSPTMQAKAMSCTHLRFRGIATATGQSSAGQAVVLSLLLPFVVFAWAVSVTVIAHFVG